MRTIERSSAFKRDFKKVSLAPRYRKELNAASEDDDPKTYLTALRKVVEARGGMRFKKLLAKR
jgi:DNA-binding phage protein